MTPRQEARILAVAVLLFALLTLAGAVLALVR